MARTKTLPVISEVSCVAVPSGEQITAVALLRPPVQVHQHRITSRTDVQLEHIVSYLPPQGVYIIAATRWLFSRRCKPLAVSLQDQRSEFGENIAGGWG